MEIKRAYNLSKRVDFEIEISYTGESITKIVINLSTMFMCEYIMFVPLAHIWNIYFRSFHELVISKCFFFTVSCLDVRFWSHCSLQQNVHRVRLTNYIDNELEETWYVKWDTRYYWRVKKNTMAKQERDRIFTKHTYTDKRPKDASIISIYR